MGDGLPRRHARKAGTAGLEFVGRPSRSLFKQYSDRFQQYSGQVGDVAQSATQHITQVAPHSAGDTAQVAPNQYSPPVRVRPQIQVDSRRADLSTDHAAAPIDVPAAAQGHPQLHGAFATDTGYGVADTGYVSGAQYDSAAQYGTEPQYGVAAEYYGDSGVSAAMSLPNPAQPGQNIVQNFQHMVQGMAQPFVDRPVAVDETAFAEPIAAELENLATPQDDELTVDTIKHPTKETDKQARIGKLKAVVVAMVVLLCGAVIGWSGLYFYNNRPFFSASIKKEAGFPLYAPADKEAFELVKGSVTKGENGSIVFNILSRSDGNRFIVSQQKVPDIIKEDTQYMQFLEQVDKFAVFDIQNGKAYLTKPANIGDDVTCVVKTATTLLFIRGPGTTPEAQWVRIADSIRAVN